MIVWSLFFKPFELTHERLQENTWKYDKNQPVKHVSKSFDNGLIDRDPFERRFVAL